MGVTDRLLPAAVASCAGLIGCSFLPWLSVTYIGDFIGPVTVSKSGTEVYGFTSVGDGQVVAVSASIGIMTAVIAGANPDLRRLAGFVLAVVGLVASGIAAYDVMLSDRGFDYATGHLGYYPRISKLHGLWLTLPLSSALAWLGVLLTHHKVAATAKTRIQRPLDPATPAMLIPMAAASALLTVLAFVPWFTFRSFSVTGENAEVVTGAGDGYVLAVLSFTCLGLTAWMLRTKAFTNRMLGLLAAVAAGTLVIAALNLTAQSDVCGQSPVLGLTNAVQCGSRFGSDGGASVYLWLATGLSTFLAIAALVVLAIQRTGSKDRDTMSGIWA